MLKEALKRNLSAFDNAVLDIIGRDSAMVNGMNVSESRFTVDTEADERQAALESIVEKESDEIVETSTTPSPQLFKTCKSFFQNSKRVFDNTRRLFVSYVESVFSISCWPQYWWDEPLFNGIARIDQ
uniref:Uncharacterized protein n=1 Tax=Romanomermis culicivorax TaxID=13658 RepID=A0A915KAM9_ROMCU